MGYSVDNKIDMVLDKERFSKVTKGMKKIDVWENMTKIHGLDIQYKSFLNLLENRVTWRLVYAYALAQVLGLQIDDLFVIVNVSPKKPVTVESTQTASHISSTL
jgi:hypothetical protein